MKFLILMALLSTASAYSSSQLSRELTPKFSPGYYADQSDKYFNTLDTYRRKEGKPKYSKNVIRYEWYPWLILTGYKSWMMKLDFFLTLYPTKVINRVCKGFNVQPFGRCHVTFMYKGHDDPVDIYEEFTFNDQGEITFIEAWTDSPEFFPTDDFSDYWAEGEDVKRISTIIPGLGRSDGLVNRKSKEFIEATKKSPLLFDLGKRLKNPVYFWTKELIRFTRKK